MKKSIKLSLLEQTEQIISEGPIADAVKAAGQKAGSSIMSLHQKLIRGRAAEKAEKLDRVTGDAMRDNDSALQKIAGLATQHHANETRLVIHLQSRIFSELYLVSGGGHKLADPAHFGDNELNHFLANPLSPQKVTKENGEVLGSRLIEMPKNFTFSQQLSLGGSSLDGNLTVLIDVPTALLNSLKSYKDNLPKAREILVKIFSHKFYLMTIFNDRAKAVSAKVDAAIKTNSIDELKLAFDPHIIENYPYKHEKIAAIDEWDALKRESEKKDEEPETKSSSTDLNPTPAITPDDDDNEAKLAAAAQGKPVSGKTVEPRTNEEIQKEIQRLLDKAANSGEALSPELQALLIASKK